MRKEVEFEGLRQERLKNVFETFQVLQASRYYLVVKELGEVAFQHDLFNGI